MVSPVSPDSDFASLRKDLESVKNDVASLLEHLKTDAGANAESAINRIEEGGRQAFKAVTDQGSKSISAIGRQIEAQPIAALLIAAGIGWIGGRVLLR